MSVKSVLIPALMGIAILGNMPVIAHEKGDFILRAGAALVDPNEKSGIIQPQVVSQNGKVSIDSDTQLGLTATYMFGDNWGVELLAATPFTHTVSFAGDLEGLGDLATAKHLPPTISAQYYFDLGNKFTPYLGAGLNYTLMLETKATANGQAVLDTVGTGGNYNIDADDSFGVALQAGFDYKLTDKLYLNGAIWYMDIETTITVADSLKVDLDIDPWVYMLGLGYKF